MTELLRSMKTWRTTGCADAGGGAKPAAVGLDSPPTEHALAFLGGDLLHDRFEFLAQLIFHRHEDHAHAVIALPRQGKTQSLTLAV